MKTHASIDTVRAMALDAGKNGIRVNAVNPGFTKTRTTEDMLKDPELVANFREHMPLGAPEDPDGIAAAIAFLASDDAGCLRDARFRHLQSYLQSST